jgi:hypothetical protein
MAMILRCVIDGLLLPAEIHTSSSTLTAYDGEEGFALEALEALYYEIVTATTEELRRLECAHFRLLRRAHDFRPLAVTT